MLSDIFFLSGFCNGKTSCDLCPGAFTSGIALHKVTRCACDCHTRKPVRIVGESVRGHAWASDPTLTFEQKMELFEALPVPRKTETDTKPTRARRAA